MDAKEGKSGILEDQDEVELACLEDRLRFGAFSIEEMARQMQNIFDWEEDAEDPFEKAVARSQKTSSKPMNDSCEDAAGMSGEASSNPENESFENAVARNGEASNKPMNNPFVNNAAMIGEASDKPMNNPFVNNAAMIGEASDKPMNNPFVNNAAMIGGTSDKPMNNPFVNDVARSGGASDKPMNNPFVNDVARSGGASDKPMNNPFVNDVARSEASSEPMNDPYEEAVAPRGEVSDNPRNITEHSRTCRGQRLDQCNAHRLQNHSQQVRSCQDQEPQKESATNFHEFQEVSWRRQDSSPGRGYDRGTRQQPRSHSVDSYGKYSPRDTCDTQDDSNSCCDTESTAFQEHPYRRQHGASYAVSPRRQNRGTWQQPHRRSDTSCENRLPRGVSNMQSNRIKLGQLVEVLVECPDFKASLLQLLEWKNMHPSFVRDAVLTNGHVFHVNREVVELHPQIGICQAHLGSQGCQNPYECNDLHICHTYISNYCQVSNCPVGHKWFTSHNKIVLRNFYLEQLPAHLLRRLMKGFVTVTRFTDQLDVCSYYNGMGCIKRDCTSLHVCHSIFRLTKCAIQGCHLNHSLLTPDCCELLRAHGFSTNEAPQDIAIALLAAYPSLGSGSPGRQAAQRPPTTGQARENTTTFDQHQDAGSIGNRRVGDDSIVSRGASAIGSGRLSHHSNNSNPSKNKKGNVSRENFRTDNNSGRGGKTDAKSSSSSKASSVGNKEKRKTSWSYHLCGDAEINEICFYSVESTCKYEKSGCRRLHAVQNFHWQISEQGNSWLNLRTFQVNCLERAFCNPAEDGVAVPRLDPAKTNASVHHLLTLLGQDTWHANFQAMIINNSNYSRILYLRRLCTEFIDGQRVKASVYHWFFIDKNNKWVEYGKVDTAGETKLVSPITSADIEKHFLRSPDTPLSFKNASYTYLLDFRTMTQTNQSTKAKREVRRRPKAHFKDEKRGSGQKPSISKT